MIIATPAVPEVPAQPSETPDWHARVARILVIKWSAMGDIALASMALDDIRRYFPNAELHWNTLPVWRCLFEQDPRIDRLISFDVRARRGVLRANLKWLNSMVSARYDLVIDLQTTDRSAILLGLMRLAGRGIPYRAGNVPRWPYNLAPRDSHRGLPAFERQRKTLASAAIPARATRPVLYPGDQRIARMRRLRTELGVQDGAFAVFLPGSQAAGHLKRWGAMRYAALARILVAQYGLRVLVLGGPDEVSECRLLVREAGEGVIDLCNRTDILELIPLTAGARFVVANDTGTAHIIAANDLPMFVICGPTDPRRVRPAGERVTTLQADLPCINCYAKTCSHHSCMREITPEFVHAQLRGAGLLEA